MFEDDLAWVTLRKRSSSPISFILDNINPNPIYSPCQVDGRDNKAFTNPVHPDPNPAENDTKILIWQNMILNILICDFKTKFALLGLFFFYLEILLWHQHR